MILIHIGTSDNMATRRRSEPQKLESLVIYLISIYLNVNCLRRCLCAPFICESEPNVNICMWMWTKCETALFYLSFDLYISSTSPCRHHLSSFDHDQMDQKVQFRKQTGEHFKSQASCWFILAYIASKLAYSSSPLLLIHVT